MTQFFAIFHPLFLVFYITLFLTSMYIFKIYFLENDNVNFVVSSLCFISLLISVWKFPTNLGDGLLAFAGYIALACAPSSFLVLILAKILAEFLIGAKDFMKLAKRDPIEELEELIEGMVVAGRFDEAIQILRDKMKLKQNKNEYRLNSEIATISLMYLKDYGTALSEFEEVVKKTDKEEPVTFALYRMADIYLTYKNDKKKAIDCLKRIMKQFPNSEYSKSARIRVEFLEKSADEDLDDEIPTAGKNWRMGSAAQSEKVEKEAYDMCPQTPHEPYDMSADPSQITESLEMNAEFFQEDETEPLPAKKASQEVDWRRGALAREKPKGPKKGLFKRRESHEAPAGDDDDF
ncbi:MAG: tol-pal system YbgF family protein [Candidatus Xenobiia bacterium LiM19]